MWGELMVLSGFGDIQSAFVHASVGSRISFGGLPVIAGPSPLCLILIYWIFIILALIPLCVK